jgi:mono/diheme cytochrome c family protein
MLMVPFIPNNSHGPIIVIAATFCALSLAGCQQKMASQPSFGPDDPCEFFSDGAAARPPVTGTVARGHLRTDAALYFGRNELPATPVVGQALKPAPADSGDAQTLLQAEAQQFTGTVDAFPFSITRDIVERGRNRYMIYCVVCHDAVGNGAGKIVERGYTKPPSYHIDRLRAAPVGYLFRVVSQGYGSMPSYAGQIPVRDRWAIVSYVRALQLSQHYPADKLPDEIRKQLHSGEKLASADEGAL